MKIITKIINLIHNSFATLPFQGLLENPEDPDFILHTEVHWLSKGRVLARFGNLIEEIKKSPNA